MAKLSNDVLQKIGVYQWNDIKNYYLGSDLFLGNGFSIKISESLNYRSLFKKFIDNLNEQDKAIFEKFGTTNFELILEKINNAISVNEIFNLGHGLLIQSVVKLRNGLIESINQNHPKHRDLQDITFNKISVALDDFGDIFTTNYDTFLYRVIMQTKDRYDHNKEKVKPYQDYFWRTTGDFLQFMDTQNFSHYKNVYFLHGALFIFQNDLGHFKIRRGRKDTELLELIYEKITSQQFPLFVAEGKFQDKENKISRSGYLSFCRTMLRNAKNSMVVYGSSLSQQDTHLVNDLNYHSRNLAISVRCDNRTESDLRAIRLETVAKFNRMDKEVTFFDADSLF